MTDDKLPHTFGTMIEAACYADELRAKGENRPMEAVPLPDGRAVLKYIEKGQNDGNTRIG